MPTLFSEHAVLQRSSRVPIWGKGEPGEAITVTLDTVVARSQAGADGAWKVSLDLHNAGPGPFVLTVAGKNRLTIPDVVIGEVWLCSGQSNMTLPLSATTNAATEIAASANPLLREFTVKLQASGDPLNHCEGQWVLAGPATSGAFTAAGYYFGKTVQQKLNVPVGLIHSSWGGSYIEAWMSAQAMDGDPNLKAYKDKVYQDLKGDPDRMKQYVDQYKAWEARNDRQDHPYDAKDYAAPDVSTKDWTPVTVPGSLAKQGLPDSGAIWLRCKVQVPEPATHNYHALHFAINDFDAFYWNGRKIGETTFDKSNAFSTSATATKIRRYDIWAGLMKPGENTLALRIFAPAGDAGAAIANVKIADPPLILGPWLAKAEFALPPLSAEARAAYPAHPPVLPSAQAQPTYLYNGMIQPLLPYAIRGTLWYQGEANAGHAAQYQIALRLLIEDWRAKWDEGNFPFYICQLPNFMAKQKTPSESGWAEMREAQAKMLALPQTGVAVLIDIGEADNIHPKDKKDVGTRLAQLALSKTYGQAIPGSGPTYQRMQVEGGKVRITFAQAEDGLVAKPLPDLPVADSKPPVPNSPGSEIEGFTICGSDHQWHWAQAKIENNTVLVSAPGISAPVAVRYAWADNPTCNLYGKSGLPAAPFRTDDFPHSH